MDRYTVKDEIIDAIGIVLMVPVVWACWTLLCCVSA